MGSSVDDGNYLCKQILIEVKHLRFCACLLYCVSMVMAFCYKG